MSRSRQFPQNIEIYMAIDSVGSNVRLPRMYQFELQFQLYYSSIDMINNIYMRGHHYSIENTNEMISELFENVRRMVDNNRNNGIGTPPIYPLRTYVYTPQQQHQNPLEKTKVISKKKLEESCPEECSICRDTPKNKDSICTECNHYFCKPCWSSWMNAERSNKSCPNCRKDMPKITSYRARVSKKRVVDVESLNTELDA